MMSQSCFSILPLLFIDFTFDDFNNDFDGEKKKCLTQFRINGWEEDSSPRATGSEGIACGIY